MQTHAFPMCAAILREIDMPGYQVSYRFHWTDPARFSRRVNVTIEHGRGSHLSDDWSSTACWYQAPPSKPVTVPAVEDRLPTRLESSLDPSHMPSSAFGVEETVDMRSALDAAAERGE